MHDDVVDQLRRYGEAIERFAVVEEKSVVAVSPTWWWRRRGAIAAAACLAVVVGLAALATLRREDEPSELRTTSDAGTSTTIAAPSSTTAVVPLLTTVEGTATWLDGPDPRGTLWVGACPSADPDPDCPHMRTAPVAPDGSFTLALPSDSTSVEWDVAAYVGVSDTGCVFNCRWRGAQAGPTTTVEATRSSQPALQLSVSARVIDLYVLDRAGNAFAGGGIQVSDPRCTTDPCPGPFAAMFMAASDIDGSARIVVDPSVTYEFHGQAVDTGWPDPAWTDGGSEFWFSRSEILRGSDLLDGHVFLIEGGPAAPGE